MQDPNPYEVEAPRHERPRGWLSHWDRHPGVRSGEQLTVGERAADKLRNGMGSWAFVFAALAFLTVWMAFNRNTGFDPYPFILLNLAFSLQAAYAAPLILLAATRQAERDKRAAALAEQRHDETETRDESAVAELRKLLENNTALTKADKELTERVAALTREIHAKLSG